MKNVKPMVGQVWEDCHGRVTIELNGGHYVTYVRHGDNLLCSASDVVFFASFKFIPQNDLEWLAVNVDVWVAGKDYDLIRRHKSDEPVWSKTHVDNYKYCTRDQWQSMRYELGLNGRTPKEAYREFDSQLSKDFEEFAKGCGIDIPSTLNCPCTLAPLKKEPKMIDLSTAVVGDKFLLNNGNIVSFFARTKMNSICELETGHAMLYEHNGKFDESVECGNSKDEWDIVSKHDSRHWLKDLPDADLFSEDVEFLASDNDSVWWGYGDDPEINGRYFEGVDSWPMHPLKMPTLTGDEWKLSKISIVELRAWQKEQKDNRTESEREMDKIINSPQFVSRRPIRDHKEQK